MVCSLQLILFKKSSFTTIQAKSWLWRHGYTASEHLPNIKHHKFRQHQKKDFDYYLNKSVSPGVTFVFGIKKCKGKPCTCADKLKRFN